MIGLLGLVACVGAIVCAVQGKAYRGLYFALGAGALVLGWFLLQITPSAAQVAAAAQDVRDGYVFMRDEFPSIAIGLWIFAVGGIIGGLVYRPKKAPHSASVA